MAFTATATTRPHRTNLRDVKGPGAGNLTVQTGDFAADISSDKNFLMTKGSAAAVTVAAPGSRNIGRKLTFITGSDFAHVVTFTGSTLKDGTTGAKITWTAPAFIGAAVTVRAVTATQWIVESKQAGVVA
jgi:hypothetical protein